MKHLISFFLLSLILNNLSAQQDDRIAPLSRDLNQIDLLELAPLDNKDLIREEMKLRRPGRPNYFAHTFNVNQSTQEIGTWSTLSDGSVVWRLRIHSNNAKSLNLGFSKFKMPAGGSLVIYTPDFKNILGPFTPADNEEHEQLWTPVVDGDDIIVEVWLKGNNRSSFELKLKSVNHDFIGINSASFMSGSCNLDVICGAADGWGIVDDHRDIIQSVAFMHLNGSANCTGFLVNNTAQDCTPLFMTADHCGLTNGSAPSLVTYWNFENSTCRQPNSAVSGGNGDGVLNDFNTGSAFRATWLNSDFTIVELDDPVNPTAKAYRAGWNATETLATSVIGIHHPANDEKRISFENDPVYLGNWGTNAENIPDGNHVIVPDWDIGTTEGGSSGSPLFDQNKRIVGQLHGGGAACGNDEYDSYGWFNASWEGGGRADNRLKDWLDPIDSGIMIIDGKDCGFNILAEEPIAEICTPNDAVYQMTVSDQFSNNVDLVIDGLPAGLTTTFSNNNPAPGELITLIIGNTASQPSALYPFSINATDGTDNSTTELFINLNNGVPAMTVQSSPANMSENISTNPLFEWEQSSTGTYEIELATDANFTNIITTNPMIEGETFTNNSLLNSLTTYFWRIRGNNICGTGNWSNTHSFTTANIACNVTSSTNIPISISEGGPNTIISTLEILAGGIISDINVVNLKGTHSWLADLNFILESPAGSSVILVGAICNDQDNFDINFDDQSTGEIPCPYTDGGTYPSSGPLSNFNGENPRGTWTLTIEDTATGDGGSLDNWGLTFCTIPDNSLDIISSQTEFELCEGESTNFEVYIGGGFEPPLTISPVDNTNGITLIFPSAPINPGATVSVELSAPNNAGAFDASFVVTDANNEFLTTIDVNVLGIPASATLNTPPNGSNNVISNPTFEWTNPGSYSTLNIKVSLEPDLSNSVIVNRNLPGDATDFTITNTLIEATTYYWQVTGTNDCGEVSSLISPFTTAITSGIDLLGSQYFKLLPNPTKGNLTINLAYPIGEIIHGEVFHINGRLIDSFKIPFGQQSHNLDLSNFPEGIYVVKLKHSDFTATNKVVLH